MTDLPPSTIAELRNVLIGYEAARPRSMQRELGPSELGTPCQQQIARKLAGAPRRPITEPTWAPFQGTAVHASMEQVVAYWNAQLGRERWLAEDELTIDQGDDRCAPIRGRSDAFDQDFDTVVDWKLTGVTAIKMLRTAKRQGKPAAQQVSPEYRVQGHLYGRGQVLKGRAVRFVRLVFLARGHDFDQSEEWTEEYRPDVAEWAVRRYRRIQDFVSALDLVADPDSITAIPANPSSDACKFCRYKVVGQPSGWASCAGDEQATERRAAVFAAGLI